MAKPIGNISTTDLAAFLRAAETVFMKGEQVIKSLNFNFDKLDEEYAKEQANKVMAIQGEARNVIKDITAEMDRRLKYTFGMKTSGENLDRISAKIESKLS